MRTLAELEAIFDEPPAAADPLAAAERLLRASEEVLEHWVVAKNDVPTHDEREGFRLLALHRQGAEKLPGFNACRETCRELAYHYNLLTGQPDHPDSTQRARMMGLVANHLYLFVRGKMEVEELGEFCCASRPIREKVDAKQTRQ